MIHEPMKHGNPVAVLTDGDNLSHDHADTILTRAALFGHETLSVAGQVDAKGHRILNMAKVFAGPHHPVRCRDRKTKVQRPSSADPCQFPLRPFRFVPCRAM